MDSVNKTLYIPLYGKAWVSRKGLLLRDESAKRIWEAAGFPLKGKAKSRWLAYTMGMRAAVFDRWTAEKLAENPEAVVLHPGCGLDGRVCRVAHGGHAWFDMDFPEVIAERKTFFPETEEDRMLPGDVRRPGWLDGVPAGGTAIVVMEGLSMYLQMQELKTLLRDLKAHFARVHVLMDTYTVFGAKATRYKNPINTVGVTQVYGLDDPRELTEDTGFRFAAEHDMTPDSLIGELPHREQWFFRALFAGKTAKRIYRLYEYEA